MPHNKKHHYVSRFYLKRFSTDGHSVGLWHLVSKKVIPSANLKNQCYKNYFYGKDLKIESALALLEGEAARVLRSIDQHESLPPRGTAEFLALMLFVFTQYARTAYSIDALQEANDELVKHLIGPQAAAEGIDLSKFKIQMTDPAQFQLGLFAQAFPLTLDLECKLLRNKTTEEFVTSDNPVVFYNQLFSFRRHGSNTEVASKGLQVFFPISPSQQLLFYDRDSYTIGKRSKDYVEIDAPRDIYELNTLQLASAYQNVYFRNPDFDIRPLSRKAAPFRRRRKSEMNIYTGENTKTTKRELVSTSREDVRTNLKLSFVRISKSAKKWCNNFRKQRLQPATVVRNEELVSKHEEFMSKIDEGTIEPGRFAEFLAQEYDNR